MKKENVKKKQYKWRWLADNSKDNKMILAWFFRKPYAILFFLGLLCGAILGWFMLDLNFAPTIVLIIILFLSQLNALFLMMKKAVNWVETQQTLDMGERD